MVRTTAEATLAERFLATVTAEPDRAAVRDHARTLTRRELADHAAGLTARLRDAASRAGGDTGPVLLLPQDGLELAVMLLGSVGAGHPVVLGDRRRSAASHRALADTTGCDVVLHSGTWDDAGAAVRTLSPWEQPGRAEEWSPVRPAPDAVLLLASTSGSTAEPRIIVRRHSTVLASLTRADALTGINPSDRVGRHFAADSATASAILRAAATGATLILLDPRRMSPFDVLPTFAAHGTTHAWFVPSTLRLLMRTVPAGGAGPMLPDARVVGLSGEPVTVGDLRALARTVPGSCLLVNRYSSTETGNIARRVVTAEEVLSTDPAGVGPLALDDAALLDVGEPLPGRHVWIDAGEGRAAAPGVLGQVVVEGALHTSGEGIEQLADGTQRFRSGDVGFLDPEGRLHLRGRSDRVVKVGGTRVVLAAVEAAMRELDGIADVVVVAEPVSGTDVRLVAHVELAAGAVRPTAGDGTDGGPAGWRTALTERISSVAVPARLVVHEAGLPRLPAGKPDLRSLAPD